eukprot:CAMPEP_0172599674 /NCGR_PEP_ID=MMETSP1068-20121228/19788_1 /TAXON_ID=35684 /ORGANISM="Pseudopedinella elastica, Strain CCMP716" /LENGTH=279 /DNA_ID=CAMNT_0013400007 /DNA_START=77 /DNA_END=916 /DNA_ORIENTATION=+
MKRSSGGYDAVPADIESNAKPLDELPVATPLIRRQSSRDDKTKHPLIGHTSHFWAEDSELYQGDHTQELRMGFLRKVYGILCIQLLLTCAVAGLCMGPWSAFVLANSTALVWGSFVPIMITLFMLMLFKDSYPINYWLLAVFTFLEAVTIGVFCAAYKEAGYGDLIFEAAVITASVFVTLTLFACQTKIDFTVIHGFLVAALQSMIMWSFFSMIFGFSLGSFYSWIGALVFCLFIVVDTQLIMDRLGYDDYIIASIDLYLDIINLFLYILRILASSRSR